VASHIERRKFLATLGGATAWPLAARAQQPERMRRIGVLMGTTERDADQQALVSALVRTLADLGWREGSNIQIEYRWASGDAQRLQAHAAELSQSAPDVIFAQGTPATTALRRGTGTTPIVFVHVTDPISAGLVPSLARPGGNVTGFTNYELTMGVKWLELLKEVSPGMARVAVLHNPDNRPQSAQVREIEAEASKFAVQVSAAPVRRRADIEPAIDEFARGASGGLVIINDFILTPHHELIAMLAARHRLPSIANLSVNAASGALMSYAVNSSDLFRRAATYIDRILKGAKPADLPVQAPTKYELVINLKTAKALGLEVPPTLLARADEVIE
jgi:putative ABC transport system substrate-binding protein